MDTAATQTLIVQKAATTPDELCARPGAPIWLRAAARTMDLLTVFAILWMLSVLHVLWFMEELSNSLAPPPWHHAFAATVTFVAIAAAYDTYFLRHNKGQTPGKDICRICVIHDGRQLSTTRAFARASVTSLPWLCPPIWLGAALAGALGAPALLRHGRAAQDWVAGTRVVAYDRTREDPDAPPPAPFFRQRKSRGEPEVDA